MTRTPRLSGWTRFRPRIVHLSGSSMFRSATVLISPLGILAIEAGWTVTEVGRQPWIIQGVMRTAGAVTPVPGLWISLLVYSTLYVFLGLVVALLLARQFRASLRPDENVAASTPEGAH